jgi:hypothetical protein
MFIIPEKADNLDSTYLKHMPHDMKSKYGAFAKQHYGGDKVQHGSQQKRDAILTVTWQLLS